MRRGIAELLADNGQISLEELVSAQAEQKKTNESMSSILGRLGLADENKVKNVLELEYGVTYVSLGKITPHLATIHLVAQALIVEHEAVPVSQEGNRLTLAMVTPSDEVALAAFKNALLDWQVKPVVCNEDDFYEFLVRANILASRKQLPQESNDLKTKEDPFSQNQKQSGTGLEGTFDKNDNAALVRLAAHILSNAVTRGCSNIHIEPEQRQLSVHYRKDGVLFNALKLPPEVMPALLDIFKELALIPTSQQTLPLDGRFNLNLAGRQCCFRLSIVAGSGGEHLIIWLD